MVIPALRWNCHMNRSMNHILVQTKNPTHSFICYFSVCLLPTNSPSSSFVQLVREIMMLKSRAESWRSVWRLFFLFISCCFTQHLLCKLLLLCKLFNKCSNSLGEGNFEWTGNSNSPKKVNLCLACPTWVGGGVASHMARCSSIKKSSK